MVRVSRRQCLTASASLAGGLLGAACDVGGSQTPQEADSSPPTPRPLPKPAKVPATTKQPVTLHVFTGLGMSAMHQGFWHRGGPKAAFESKHPTSRWSGKGYRVPLPASRWKRPSVR